MALTYGLKSPRDLFEKVKRDAQLLVQDLTSDKFFNFVVTGYSIIDWVKNDPSISQPVKSAVINLYTDPWIKVCGDLANASKHFTLDEPKRTPITASAESHKGHVSSPSPLRTRLCTWSCVKGFCCAKTGRAKTSPVASMRRVSVLRNLIATSQGCRGLRRNYGEILPHFSGRGLFKCVMPDILPAAARNKPELGNLPPWPCPRRSCSNWTPPIVVTVLPAPPAWIPPCPLEVPTKTCQEAKISRSEMTRTPCTINWK
jgi:hypothetical protein